MKQLHQQDIFHYIYLHYKESFFIILVIFEAINLLVIFKVLVNFNFNKST